METQNYTVRAHRGGSRIWIEGKRLQRAGFVSGVQYCIGGHSDTPACIVLSVHPEGKRKVSGNATRPIIDIAETKWGFNVGDDVKIEYSENQILIKVEGV